MTLYTLVLPDDFEDFAWELEAKGWYECRVSFSDKEYDITFYDIHRLTQDVKAKLENTPMFHQKNLVLVNSITLKCMQDAVSYLAESGKYLEFFEVV